MADKTVTKNHYVDNGWPTKLDGEHAVSEFAAPLVGAMSPYGDLALPVDHRELPYIHPRTVINR